MTVTPVNAIAIWEAPAGSAARVKAAGSAARVEANDPISRIPISTNVEVFIHVSFVRAASSAFLAALSSGLGPGLISAR
jgi:hypothetical protein